jgi:hypothetical protein
MYVECYFRSGPGAIYPIVSDEILKINQCELFCLFLDFDSVDKVILARPHTINEYHVDVKKAVPKDQRQFQAQQQQYSLQMQAAATYYYYNNLSYNILNNPITSPSSLIIPNGAHIDDVYSHFQPSNNNSIPNSHRYLSTRNNRRQSSRGSH